jgi:hypothetical protein
MVYEAKQNVAKRSEKRPIDVKKRGNLIEKQKAHEKIGQLDLGNVSNQIRQHIKFGKHTTMPMKICEN